MDSARLSYHWTPPLERRFIRALVESGSVRLAARAVGMSAKSAYARRNTNAAFALDWQSAIRTAREVMFDLLLGGAMDGVQTHQVRSVKSGRLGWRVIDKRLGRGRGLRQLDRLDATLAQAGEKAVSSLPFAENRHSPKRVFRA